MTRFRVTLTMICLMLFGNTRKQQKAISNPNTPLWCLRFFIYYNGPYSGLIDSILLTERLNQRTVKKLILADYDRYYPGLIYHLVTDPAVLEEIIWNRPFHVKSQVPIFRSVRLDRDPTVKLLDIMVKKFRRTGDEARLYYQNMSFLYLFLATNKCLSKEDTMLYLKLYYSIGDSPLPLDRDMIIELYETEKISSKVLLQHLAKTDPYWKDLTDSSSYNNVGDHVGWFEGLCRSLLIDEGVLTANLPAIYVIKIASDILEASKRDLSNSIIPV